MNSQIRLSGALVMVPLVSIALSQVAWGHPGHSPFESHQAGGWLAGLLHPLVGVDHLLAVLASGLLAVRVGTSRALWLVPLVFAGLMLAGGLLAAAGFPLPLASWSVGLSVLALGLAVAMLPSVPAYAAALLVGAFALAHGYAHVSDAGQIAAAPYLAGMTLTTVILHAAAIGVGIAALRCERPQWVRLGGVAVVGCFGLSLML